MKPCSEGSEWAWRVSPSGYSLYSVARKAFARPWWQVWDSVQDPNPQLLQNVIASGREVGGCPEPLISTRVDFLHEVDWAYKTSTRFGLVPDPF